MNAVTATFITLCRHEFISQSKQHISYISSARHCQCSNALWIDKIKVVEKFIHKNILLSPFKYENPIKIILYVLVSWAAIFQCRHFFYSQRICEINNIWTKLWRRGMFPCKFVSYRSVVFFSVEFFFFNCSFKPIAEFRLFISIFRRIIFQ